MANLGFKPKETESRVVVLTCVVHQTHLQDLLKHKLLVPPWAGVEQVLGICISNMFPAEDDASGPGTILETPLL